jgi:hypothetical protein
VGVTLDKGIRELSSAELSEHREHVHFEARERISGIGGALRLSLNNMAVGSLREYIALSRHQLEMSEYIGNHTGGTSATGADEVNLEVIDWPTGRYYPYEPAQGPRSNESKVSPAWEVDQIRDVMWRVKAVGGVLGRSGNRLVASDADGLTELSRHQCEIADFMRTGRFKKVPRRRKARYLGGDGTQSAETAERVRELGEALKEYQGRIEIKTVREFIALSKHQCELAGMVMASEREMKGKQSFELVHYSDAYSLNDNGSFHHRDTEAQRKKGHIATECTEKKTNNNHPSCHGRLESLTTLTGENAKRADASEYEQRVPYIRKSERSEWLKSRGSVRSEKTTSLDTPVKPEYDSEGNHAAGVAGETGNGENTTALDTSCSDLSARLAPEIGASRGFDPSLCLSDSVVNTSWQSLSLHGTIKHPTGVPAENIRVQLDIGAEGESVLSLDEITDREGRFTRERAWSYRLVPRFEAGEDNDINAPPDNLTVRGELFNRLMREPLRDAEVYISIRAGGGERTFSSITDFKGHFSAGEGVPEQRKRGNPLWTQVEHDGTWDGTTRDCEFTTECTEGKRIRKRPSLEKSSRPFPTGGETEVLSSFLCVSVSLWLEQVFNV